MESVSKKLSQLLTLQKIRYSRKGPLNITIALLSLFMILYSAQRIGKKIWPQQIKNKQLFVAVISFSIHFVFQALYFLVYLPGYANYAKFYQKYRINFGVVRPWEGSPQQWKVVKKRLLFYLGINYFVVYPAMVFISVYVSGIKVRFDQFPTMFQLAWQLIFVSFVEDAGFYWAHRIAHETNFMYKFHKIHHQYTQVFSLATEYMHPIDYIVGVLIPSAIPFILLGSRAHCFMFFFWQIWKIAVSTQGHCGYYFPWSPTRIFLFVSDPSFHDFHHSKNVGNYCGSIYLWDHFYGSSDVYFQKFYGKELQKIS